MKVFKPYSLVYKVLILTTIIYISSLGQDHTYSSFIKLIPDDFLFNSSLQNEFSDVSLSKNVAEKVSKYLLETHYNHIKEDRKKEMTNREVEISDLQMKFFYKTFGKKPKDGRSMYISMHGGGQVESEYNDQQWENQKTLYSIEEGVYLVPRAPTNTWDLWHQVHIDTFFHHIIQNMIVHLDVDPNRVYIMGYSAGGDGVYQLAPRMADRLAAAAMMAGHPNETSPLGLRNIGFTIHMGENDTPYSRNTVAIDWKKQLSSLHKKDPKGYKHHVEIHQGMGHWLEGRDSVAIPWISEFIRNPFPKRVVWKQDDVTRRQFYWLGVKNPQSRSEIIANMNDQTIVIEKSDVQNLVLYFNDTMLNMDKKVLVEYNGEKLFYGNVERDLKTIAASIKRYADPHMIYYGSLEVKIPIDVGL